jgi:predicted DNA-binding transcriptional regulator AlpA
MPKSIQADNRQVFLPDQGFVRLTTILGVFPVGRSTWWAGVKSGRFPAPVKLGPRLTAWRVKDIQDLIAAAGTAVDRNRQHA